jgi:hypothetical protein
MNPSPVEEGGMRKTYTRPECSCQSVQLGVFGNYGEGSGGGTAIDRPIRVLDGFRLHSD